MISIYFFSPAGYMPMKDEIVKALTTGSHGWQPDAQTWVYGVCYPFPNVHPEEVVERLQELGVIVLPGVHDPDTEPDPQVHQALKYFGVVPGDKTRHIAKKMHIASGHPLLKPHFF